MAKSKTTPGKEAASTVKGVTEEMVAELTTPENPPSNPPTTPASNKAAAKPTAKPAPKQAPKPDSKPASPAKPKPEKKVEAFVSRTDVDHKLHEALTAGRWSPLISFFIALLLWGSFGYLTFDELGGADGIAEMNPLAVASEFVLVFLLGFLVVVAGFMARGSTRAARANALVLQAGVSLLRPSQNVTNEIKTFSDEIATGTTNVNKVAVTAIESMKVLSANIEGERVKLEEVAANATKDAKSLVEKIESERARMEQLSQDINNQSQNIINAIPKQSEVMKDAISQAQAEMSQVDDALERRVQMMEKVGETLGGKLVELEELTKDSTTRIEQVVAMATELEGQLSLVQKSIDAAGEQSKSAAEIAGNTGIALKDAVATAIDSAKVATVDIYAKTRTASEEMARALADLRMQSENTVASLRSTGVAARSETDVAEKRLMSVAHVIERATNVVISGLEEAARAESSPLPVASEASTEPVAKPEPEPAAVKSSDTKKAKEDSAPAVTEASAEKPADEDSSKSDETDTSEEETSSGDNAEDVVVDREQLATQFIERLQESGIQLAEIITPRSKKKIWNSARKGEKDRRTATKREAGRELDRVVKRFKSDEDLRKMAESFVEAEKDDALTALNNTGKTANNASPRLTAFLLADAALAR